MLGIGSIFAGIGVFESKPSIAMAYLVISIISIPPLSKKLQKLIHVKLSRSVKILVILILFVYIGTNLGQPSKTTNIESNSATSVSTKEESKTVIKVTASKLIADYKANEISADTAYKGKDVEVTGIVGSIAKDIMDTPYITLTNGDQYAFESVQCFFAKADEQKLTSITKGKSKTITGIVTGKFGNVLIKDCTILE